jgi:hypothetical protein
MTLGVLGILVVLYEVKARHETLVGELQDLIGPSVFVVVDQVGALRLNKPILRIRLCHYGSHNGAMAQQIS